MIDNKSHFALLAATTLTLGGGQPIWFENERGNGSPFQKHFGKFRRTHKKDAYGTEAKRKRKRKISQYSRWRNRQ